MIKKSLEFFNKKYQHLINIKKIEILYHVNISPKYGNCENLEKSGHSYIIYTILLKLKYLNFVELIFNLVFAIFLVGKLISLQITICS